MKSFCLSALMGRLIASWVPIGYFQSLSAASFLAFAIWTLWDGAAEGKAAESERHPALLIGVTFFLAELGDKTMLTAVRSTIH